VNIVDLVQGDGIELKRVAATHGGEYCGRCLRCSGHDRFRVWPQWPNSKGGRYWCRGCGWRGDAIEYLKTFRQMSFKEACDYLGFKVPINFRRISGHKMGTNKSQPKWEPRQMQTPSDQWQSEARKYLKGAIYNLWGPGGQRWLGWLQEIRGLNEATIRTYKLGLQPINRWEEREDWGLERVVKDNGKLKKLWFPEGLVIPYFINDQISKISFRRKKSAGEPRYFHLDGSHSHPMVLYPERDILIVVESALDGFLLGQEAGDLAGVVILGSAQGQPDKELASLLRCRRLILLALDADAAGARDHRWWLEQFPNSRRWPPIRGKDPGEMLQMGVDLRLWIEVGIARFLDEVTEPAEEENELLSSGNGHGTEPQPQASPSLDKAIGGQEYQSSTLAPEPLEGKPEPAAVELVDYLARETQPSERLPTCADCPHFSASLGPNPRQALGRCLKRGRGRYGCATACEAALTDNVVGV